MSATGRKPRKTRCDTRAVITPYGHGIHERRGRSFWKPRSARWVRGMGPWSQRSVMACPRLATTLSPSVAGRPESRR
eukprot:14066488-Heterocapsa_arctica.AAC.1